MRVLITGAHGYLGSEIFRAFAGYERTALVSPWGNTQAIAEDLTLPGTSEARADLASERNVANLVAGHNVVVHAAARATDYGPWEAFERINVHGTKRLAEAAKAAGVQRFVFISTVAVHRYSGFTHQVPSNVPRDEHTYAYAVSKRQAEDALWALASDTFEVVVLRPGLWPHGARDPSLTRIVQALRSGWFPLVNGGRAQLNTVSASTFALAVRQAALAPNAPGTWVISDAGAPTWREVFSVIAHAAGVRAPRLSVPGWLLGIPASGIEQLYAMVAPQTEPPLTRYRARLMRNSVHFDPAPAARALGYELQPWDATLRASVQGVLAQ